MWIAGNGLPQVIKGFDMDSAVTAFDVWNVWLQSNESNSKVPQITSAGRS